MKSKEKISRNSFSKKVSLLVREGYSQKQAVAIAFSMFRRQCEEDLRRCPRWLKAR